MAVADADRDVFVARLVQSVAGLASEGRAVLDASHFVGDLGGDRGVIATVGADFEHAIVGSAVQQVGHSSNHVRRADRLVRTDRERSVGVRPIPVRRRDERVARHRPERCGGRVAFDPAPIEQAGNETFTLGAPVVDRIVVDGHGRWHVPIRLRGVAGR